MKKRKEVNLDGKVIEKLEKKASESNRNLKNYMEDILIKESNK